MMPSGTMTEETAPERILDVPQDIHEAEVCPFTKGMWKKAGDVLIFFMIFISPILFLVSLLITNLA